VVLPGIALALAGTIAFTQVSATTPYALLGGSLFVRGIGLGATMMPTMAAAYASLSREAVPKATTAINIVRQVGGSLGTAVIAVVLARNITHKFPVAGAGHDFTQFGALPPGARTQAAPLLAEAFGQTFLVALALTAAHYIPAIFLPKRAPAAMGAGG
jgi:hypothetical protein